MTALDSLREQVRQARSDYYEQALGHGEKAGHEEQEARAYGRVEAYDDVLRMLDGPGAVCVCGVERRYHRNDGTIQPTPWSDETCEGFDPAGSDQ